MTTLISQQSHRSGHRPWPPDHRDGHHGGPSHPGGTANLDCAVIPARVPRLAAGHADDAGPDEVPRELVERGLRRYTAQVAAIVGADPDAAWCEWADAPSAYIPLDDRLPGYPDRDTALIWAAEQGWAVAAETGCGEDLLITDSLGGDVLAPPRTVAQFTHAVLTGRHTDAAATDGAVGDLARRLVDWSRHESTLDDRHGLLPHGARR